MAEILIKATVKDSMYVFLNKVAEMPRFFRESSKALGIIKLASRLSKLNKANTVLTVIPAPMTKLSIYLYLSPV